MVSLVCYEPAVHPRAWFEPTIASQTSHDPALAPRPIHSSRDFHEVWDNNLDEEFSALLGAVSRAGGPRAKLAMDMEFPGFPCPDPRGSSQAAHYQALRSNVDKLWPIQLGIAVMGSDGRHHGVWTFNLRFDAAVEAHTEESLDFLRAAGIDFPRHRTEGIKAIALGRRLGNSSLVGLRAPCWLTFSGSYDWAYLLKLVTLGRALPDIASSFDKVLLVYCPRRQDLRQWLPNGSLEVLGKKYGVKRWGSAHTAGSDALLTLELFMLLGVLITESSGLDKVREHEEEVWGSRSWHNADEWYTGGTDQWYPGSIDNLNEGSTQVSWDSFNWAHGNHTTNDWFSTPSKSHVWYPSRF